MKQVLDRDTLVSDEIFYTHLLFILELLEIHGSIYFYRCFAAHEQE